jgi:UDP-glucose 4-epimerase
VRVVVFGATGNVGTSLLRALEHEERVEEIVGVARRRPRISFPRTTWEQANVEYDDLLSIVRGADAVIHLAWRIQPSRDLEAVRRTNVEGSRRVFRAVAEAGVPALVYASSVGAYSPGPKDQLVDERWPTEGVRSSFYARHKAEVERLLDTFERERPDVRVVRLRPALIFKREAAAEVRRLFLGPFLPNALVKPGRLPFVPDIPGLRFQAVHSHDIGDAYRRALVQDAHGAFNIAADPVLDARELSLLLNARPIRIPARAARVAAWLAWKARLQPSPPGWLDLGLQTPLLDASRAREELGWTPQWDAGEALVDLLEGLAGEEGLATPPLDPKASGAWRGEELASGVGARDPAERR